MKISEGIVTMNEEEAGLLECAANIAMEYWENCLKENTEEGEIYQRMCSLEMKKHRDIRDCLRGLLN